ncbi:MAG TPA: c-type cytochrome [Nitrospira sp.]|nr:c-type cytochrome [Nitrospira sp.]HNA27339.1 c-type cytochrome [Nitrospira sp.]HNI69287.1 c-type cytochrome [Nitrospira sp.]HNL89826.1 c-type cytochrome [Nitrospira sp.]HNN42819.1 c-type cytochrome [Nitrospira sp.]
MGRRRTVMIGCALVFVMALVSFPRLLLGSDQSRVKDLIQTNCAGCHRLEGKADSRFNLKAPDLIWAGSKYQRAWLLRYLTGKEAPLYPKGYRWDLAEGPMRHPVVGDDEAAAIADYFQQHNKDSRVTVGAFDLAKVSKFDVAFGGMAYKAHACLGCHLIEENGALIGGPQSASLATAGQRYDKDWLFRFGLNPQDFVPHSGEFLADATEPQLRAVIGFLMAQGVKDFKYYEPWTAPEFGMASVDRGKVLYKEYCSQCHGATGKGDGPAASGLNPKPAVHANIPFEKLPTEYLYNVINHGGAAMGKSPNMPYWGLTIGQQGVADVMAYLKATFKGGPETAQAAVGGGASGVCPQPRKTVKAPADFLAKTNPLPVTDATIQAGKTLFLQTAQPVVCAMCHGEKGNGQGLMGAALIPPPRNFTCGSTMKDLPDGQLFWIIKNGSPGTGMMSFAALPDEQVWQLIAYVRSLAK